MWFGSTFAGPVGRSVSSRPHQSSPGCLPVVARSSGTPLASPCIRRAADRDLSQAARPRPSRPGVERRAEGRSPRRGGGGHRGGRHSLALETAHILGARCVSTRGAVCPRRPRRQPHRPRLRGSHDQDAREATPDAYRLAFECAFNSATGHVGERSELRRMQIVFLRQSHNC